ncbi:MAG: hypothetical protein D6706_06265 [Chloroflexi bacterium]|nr:MAG: hypothetical protein D6706_06265 [Chloroflexota bacterium]
MDETNEVAETAVRHITHFLQTYFQSGRWPQTVALHNVEQDPAYQQFDVDLLWTVKDKTGELRVIPIEVKGDRYHQTGNFFFETISNKQKKTPGCFLYTKARWLFYYFVLTHHLYCLPVTRVRAWFLTHVEQFEERETSTPVGNNRYYVTIGRLVPINVVLEAVPGVLQFRRNNGEWQQIRVG